MPATPSPTRLVVLLFSDIVGSVQLKSRLGDAEAARIIGRHDAIFRRVFEHAGDGEILKDTGDGFLARFNTVSSAVNFSLLFQDAMRREGWPGSPLRVRVGLHLGEVSELDPDPEGGAKLSGLAIDLTARVMGLAEGGQILLTRALFDSARQYVRQHPPIENGPALTIRWMAHGPYKFKGTDEPLEVFEVGAEGQSPLHAPRDSEKAHRALAPGEDETLGWRPASGLEVPTRGGWKLERRIGEGGFGEVWLGVHEKTRVHRAFKFCFDQDRLRSLKRELTLFRVLREVLGDRDDIARLYEVQLDEAPYFLEVEFTEAGDLNNWAKAQGGIDKVPIETRLDLVARTARAVAAAHSVGVLHKDIKPSNILIHQIKGGQPRPRLSDFGIGMLADRTELEARQITISGFTGLLTENESSRTGTRLYAPPEMLVGKAFTVQGDIYALGVLLYQMVVGDLERPLAVGWERDVDDPLLREDIARCVEGDPDRRFRTAAELAERLETLPQRRRERAQELQRLEQAARRQRLVRLSVAALVVLAVLLAILGVGFLRERDLRRTAQNEAAKSQRVVAYLQDMFKSARINELGRNARIVQVLDPAVAALDAELGRDADVAATMQFALGSLYRYTGLHDEAEKLLTRAFEESSRINGPDARLTLQAMNGLGLIRLDQHDLDGADAPLTQSFERHKREYGATDQYTLEFANALAQLRTLQRRFDEAFALFKETIAAHEEIEGGFGSETVIVTANYAAALAASGAVAQAEAELRQAYERAAAQWGGKSIITLSAANNLGAWLVAQRQPEQAAALLGPLLETVREVLGPYQADTVMFSATLARAMVDLREFEQAEALLGRVLDDAQNHLGGDYPAVQDARFTYADLLNQSGRPEEAEEEFKRLLADRIAVYGADDARTLRVKGELAFILDDAGKDEEALAMYSDVAAATKASLGEDDPETIFAGNNLAAFFRSRQRYAEAEPIYAQVVLAADRVLPEDLWRRWFIHGRYGMCLLSMGQTQRAEAELLLASTGLENTIGVDKAPTQEAIARLVDCYEALNRPEDAARFRSKLQSRP
ncbi:MAG: tetratricopeptide repeat protein [Phycisphaerales bacterium]|nr:tetratricopeptide repeat protein [Phycisphaerales bacterium]